MAHGNPITVSFETGAKGEEIQAMEICAQALNMVADAEARGRVARYLHDRFGAHIVESPTSPSAGDKPPSEA